MTNEWEIICNSINEPICIVDRDYKVLKANKAFLERISKTPQQAQEGVFYRFFSDSEKRYPPDYYKGVMNSGKPAVFEIFESRLNKSFDVSIYPILDEGRHSGRAAILLKDITERKQLDQAKSEFVGIVSHELRTPLTIIREVISQFLEGILGDISPRQKEFLSIALDDVDRLTRIINSFLDMSKIEAGKFELKRSSVNLVEVANGLISSFSPGAKKRGLEIKTSFSADKIDIYADKDKITQVLLNLISNALKFTQEGSVEIRLEEKKGYIECSVIDTGMGISEQDLPKVFDKFQQFARTEGPGDKGTGLGLSITKAIVELHNGRIWVESRQGRGTAFTFTIPKYASVDSVLETINKRMKTAKKEQKDLSIFLIRLDGCLDIEKASSGYKADKVFFGALNAMEAQKRPGDILVAKEHYEIVMLSEIGMSGVAGALEVMKKVIKEAALERSDVDEMVFSRGYSVLYEDVKDARQLLEIAEHAIVNEKAERLFKRIMIVDDEAPIRDILKAALLKFGYKNISESANGAELFEKLSSGLPDLIILDIQMPGMNGYEVIGRLKEDISTKDIPIIIMSGYEVEYGQLSKYMKKKAIPVVSKPVDIMQVKKLISYML